MPWKTVKLMDQKVQMISDWVSKQYTKMELARKYCISHPTIYKWIRRYMAAGIDGLKDLKREPKVKPRKTADQIIQRIIAFKLKNHKRGPKKIYSQLTKEQPATRWPSPSTIGYWLKKHDLTVPRKRFKPIAPHTRTHLGGVSG